MTDQSKGCGGRQGLRWVGDPVDVVTGALADASAEFTVPLGDDADAGELAWRRYYNSLPMNPGPLGWGHTHEYDRTLRAVVDGWLYRQPDGDALLFPYVPAGEPSEAAGYVLRPVAGGFAVESPDTTIYEFAMQDIAGAGRLRRVSRGAMALVLGHDDRGELVRIADAAGTRVVTLEHQGGRVRDVWLTQHPGRAKDKPLLLMRYQYSESGDLLAATDRYGHAQKFTYDAAHRMLTRVDRNGYKFEYIHDSAGRCVVSRGHDRNGEVKLRYMPEAQATEVTRADGGAWLYKYDASQSITEIFDPYGGIRRFEYDDAGRMTAETDAGGVTRRPVYGATGDIVAWRTASGGLRPADSPSGPLPHRVPRTPAELELGDLAADVTSEAPLASAGIEPILSGGASIYSHVFNERDARAATRRDELGLLVEERGPAPSPRRWAYTPNGWVRWYSDHDGGRYEFEFSGGNMRSVARDPLGRELRYEYTLTDQISAVTDPAGNRHTFNYDLRDALTEVHHYGQLTESYKHDRAGNLTAKHDAQGDLLLSYQYGADGLKSVRTLADGEEHRYTYTPGGQFAGITWEGHKLEFNYTGAGKRRSDLRDGRGVEHSFLGERLASTTVFKNFTTRYRRVDPQTLEICDPIGNTHRIVLERHGVATRQLACGAREISHVDSRGHILEKHLLISGHADDVWRRQYKYSAEGDLLAVRDSERGDTNYRYDAAHQLAAVTHPDGRTDAYAYDEAANLVEAPHLPAAAFGPGNQLLMANGGSLSYDHRNNLSLWERDGRTLRLRHDGLDRLRAIDGLSAPWTADYDPLGRRIRKSFGAAITEYFWDSDRLAAELHSDGSLRIFIYVDDFSLTPWLMIDYDAVDAEPASGKLHYLVTDQRGAPVAALDAHGERVWSADLAPYGLANIKGTLEVSHRLAGQFYDPETGLCYNRFRYYSPELGRYIEEDPAGIGGGVNLYSYTHCPLAQFDARGLNTCTECQSGTCKSEDHKQKKDSKPDDSPSTNSKKDSGPPRTAEAQGEAKKVVDTMNTMCGPGSRSVVSVLTHADGTVSVGFSGKQNAKNEKFAKDLQRKLNGGKDHGKYRVSVEPVPGVTRAGNGNEPNVCAEPHAASAAHGHDSPITGTDTRWRGREGENDHPYTGTNADGAPVDAAQMNPCDTCGDATNASLYNDHANS